MLKSPIKFDDLLKIVDTLSPEQKQLLRQHIDESDWSSRFGKALTDLQADVPAGISEEEVQADIEEAIRQVHSKKRLTFDMLRVVIDTNVFVSAVIAPRSVPAQILLYWQSGAFELISCPKSIDELDEVLQRPHLVEKYSIHSRKRESLINLIRENIALVAGNSLTGIVRDDPKDDMFVACAVEGQAKYIVSGDKHLKNLERYQAIRIIDPAHFLHVIQRCQGMFL